MNDQINGTIEIAGYTVTVELVIQKLEEQGYVVRKKDECSSCGRVLDGPHYCPGMSRHSNTKSEHDDGIDWRKFN